MQCDVSFLTTLTILFLLGQNCHFFTFREVQEEKHCLLSDDVCKIYIIYLQCGDTKVTNFPFLQENSTPIFLGEDLLSATETVNLYFKFHVFVLSQRVAWVTTGFTAQLEYQLFLIIPEEKS